MTDDTMVERIKAALNEELEWTWEGESNVPSGDEVLTDLATAVLPLVGEAQAEAWEAAKVALAVERRMPNLPGSTTGLNHLLDMQARITDEHSPAKLGRWLGWAQAALVAANVGVTLDDMKAINKRYADQNGEGA